MEVVLLILKIIGIVLLSIVGLVFLFVLSMLFWPFSYRLKAHKDAENFNAAFRILWLLGLLTATVSYDKEVRLQVRVIGIPVYKLQIWPTPEETKKVENATDESVANETSTEESGQGELTKEDAFQQTAEEEVSGTVLDDNSGGEDEYFQEQDEESEMLSEENIDREIDEIINDGSEEAFEKLPFIKKVKEFILKIKEFILKFREKCYNIKDSMEQAVRKAKKLYKNIEHYYKLLQHPSIKPAWEKLWMNIKRIFRHIKPRHVKANIEFGSGDPASTMKVYGYYCMIYPFYGKKIKFIPDMENKIFNFDAKISGRVQVIRMLLMGWSLFIDKHVRRVVRLILREVRRSGRK